jgi:hypothetical protein
MTTKKTSLKKGDLVRLKGAPGELDAPKVIANPSSMTTSSDE